MIPILSLFDIISMILNQKKEPLIYTGLKSEDFVVIVPIFNDIKYLRNIGYLKQYDGKVILTTTTKESVEFYENLDNLSQKYQIKYTKIDLDNKRNKSVWRVYKRALYLLESHDKVIREILKDIDTKYVILMDADTVSNINLNVLIGNMEYYGYDLASVRILPKNPKTLIEKLQYIEYNISMKSRKRYPFLTSGAAMIGKKDALLDIFKDHSLFFSGGDIEVGKMADMKKYKIGYLPFTFFTEVPKTFKIWFNQRMMWFSGSFRHAVINFTYNFYHPFLFVYTFIMIFWLWYFKIFESINTLFIIPFLLIGYSLFNLMFYHKEINLKYAILFSTYSLFQVLVFPILGMILYIKTGFKTQNWGIFKIKVKKEYNIHKLITNITFIIFIALLIWKLEYFI